MTVLTMASAVKSRSGSRDNIINGSGSVSNSTSGSSNDGVNNDSGSASNCTSGSSDEGVNNGSGRPRNSMSGSSVDGVNDGSVPTQNLTSLLRLALGIKTRWERCSQRVVFSSLFENLQIILSLRRT